MAPQSTPHFPVGMNQQVSLCLLSIFEKRLASQFILQGEEDRRLPVNGTNKGVNQFHVAICLLPFIILCFDIGALLCLLPALVLAHKVCS